MRKKEYPPDVPDPHNHRIMYVTHVTRNNVILAFLSEHQRRLSLGLPSDSALVLCGDEGRYDLFPEIHDMIVASCAPILRAKLSTWQAMSAIARYTPKLNIDDKHRGECFATSLNHPKHPKHHHKTSPYAQKNRPVPTCSD